MMQTGLAPWGPDGADLRCTVRHPPTKNPRSRRDGFRHERCQVSPRASCDESALSERVAPVLPVITAALVVLFLAFTSVDTLARENIRLATGAEAGAYNALGLAIKGLIEDRLPDVAVTIVNTSGSIENARLVGTSQVDLALIQNDIAYYAYHGREVFTSHPLKLEGIASLYPEYVLLLVSGSSPFRSATDLLGQPVAIGWKGSGSHLNALHVLPAIGVRLAHIQPRFESLNEALPLVKAGQIAAVFATTALTPELQSDLSSATLRVLPIDPASLGDFSERYPYYLRGELPDRSVTLSVRTLLVARPHFDSDIGYLLAELVMTHTDVLAARTPQARSISLRSALDGMPTPLNPGARSFYIDNGLIVSQSNLAFLWAALLLAALLLLFIKLIHSSPVYFRALARVTSLLYVANFLLTKFKYVLTVILTVFFLVTCVFAIEHFERSYAIRYNVRSAFSNLSFSRSLIWILVFSTTSVDDSMFPQSPMGKIIVAAIGLTKIGSMFMLVGFATSDHIQRRLMIAKGLHPLSTKGHLIVCGWNKRTPALIRGLVAPELITRPKVVLLNDIAVDMPLKMFDLDDHLVSFVRGVGTNRGDLDRANLRCANAVLIVADERHPQPDGNSILITLTVEKYCKELETRAEWRGARNVYTIAEMVDEQNRSLFVDAGCDEVVCPSDLTQLIILQAVRNPGVSAFLREVLDIHEGNDLHSVEIPNGGPLCDRTYDELLPMLRSRGVLLLAVVIGGDVGKAGRSGSASAESGDADTFPRPVFTNPVRKAEVEYQVRPGDSLIVLAESERQLRRALLELMT
jgi:TRAP transporter TAXI family solute receptor